MDLTEKVNCRECQKEVERWDTERNICPKCMAEARRMYYEFGGGYWEHGESFNAIQARARGLKPLPGVPPELLWEHNIFPVEWHHVGKAGKRVNFYKSAQLTPDIMKKVRADLRVWKQKKSEAQVFEGTMKWVEWIKSGRRYDPDPKEASGTITIKGCWAILTTPEGKTVKKKVDGKHLEIIKKEEVWKKKKEV